MVSETELHENSAVTSESETVEPTLENLEGNEIDIEQELSNLSEDFDFLKENIDSLSGTLNKIDDELTQEETTVLDGETYNEVQLLAEILSTVQQEEPATTNEELVKLIEAQNTLIVEGSFAIILSIVISFAVYMFFSQLSKW